MYGKGFPNGYGGYGGWAVPNNYGQTQSQTSQNNSQFNAFSGNGQFVDNTTSQNMLNQVAWVNGEVGAQAFQIPRGMSVILMDSDNPMFYIKTSNMTGQASIKAFKYEEYQPAQQKETVEYITKEEFDKFKEEVLSKIKEDTTL